MAKKLSLESAAEFLQKACANMEGGANINVDSEKVSVYWHGQEFECDVESLAGLVDALRVAQLYATN